MVTVRSNRIHNRADIAAPSQARTEQRGGPDGDSRHPLSRDGHHATDRNPGRPAEVRLFAGVLRRHLLSRVRDANIAGSRAKRGSRSRTRRPPRRREAAGIVARRARKTRNAGVPAFGFNSTKQGETHMSDNAGKGRKGGPRGGFRRRRDHRDAAHRGSVLVRRSVRQDARPHQGHAREDDDDAGAFDRGVRGGVHLRQSRHRRNIASS